MKAFAMKAPGSRAAVHDDIPEPRARTDEVLVKIEAASINGYDAYVASGRAKHHLQYRYPVILGKDFAGVVEAVGEGVTRFQPGDRVVGVVPVAEAVARGSFAERVVVRHDDPIELLPEEVDVASGAALGLAATAALMAVEAVDPQPGEIVLVTGATGGVGVYVLQLAAERGASVIATGFPEDGEWLRRLGASSVYDYRDDIVRSVSEVLPEGIDALIDVVRRDPEELAAAASLLKKPGGRLATTQGIADVRAYAAKGITARNIAVASDPDAFRRLIEIAEDGWLMVPITRTFTLDDVDEGLSLVVSGEVRGKLSVRIDD